MLSPHDQNVVASDPDLPALRMILDDEAALELFQEICPDLQPTSARCTYLRYKPRTSCLATFALETNQGERLFYAKAYSRTNDAKFGKAVDRADSLGGCRPRCIVFRKLSLIITLFPHDDELPALEELFGSENGKPLLSRLVPEQEELQAARVVLLRYKPERRFVARLDVEDTPVAVLKIHTESRYRQARRAIKSLGPLSSFLTAQTVGHSDKYHSLLLSWLVGTPLTALLNSQQVSDSAWEAVGEAIAGLHHLKNSKLPTRSPARETREIVQQSKNFHHISESLAPRLQKLTQQCAARMSTTLSTAVTTHGDFHPGQILVSEERVVVLDLDNAALGHAGYDLGNFFAHLERANLQGIVKEDEKEQLRTDFLEGYQRQIKGVVDRRAAQLYTISGLLRLVHEPFRHRLPYWHDQQEKILQRAERMLGEVAKHSAGRKEIRKSPFLRSKSPPEVEVIDPFGAREDEGLPRLAESLNPSLAREAIGSVAQQSYRDDSLELRSIRIVRHKPGRRCLIAYQFQQREKPETLTLLGKVHAKSRHEQSFRLQQSLWNSGFDDQSNDGISVARPIGTIGQWNMWLQEYVPGQNGWQALLGPESDTVSRQIADAAHKLHQTEILTERVHTIEDELQILEQKLPQVLRQMPRLQPRIDAVLERCRELASTLSTTQKSGIHRDFYPDQVLVNEGRIVILDHDLYCCGHPSLDIGNFCAHLIEMGLRQRKHAKTYAEAGRKIVDRFAALSGDAVRQDLDAYTTLSLVRHIFLSTCFANRASATLSILSACEKRLAELSLSDKLL